MKISSPFRWFPVLCLAVWQVVLAPAAQAAETFSVGEFKFMAPAGWEQIPVNSPMRKAQLKVPGEAGNGAAEVVFFHFGAGQGGNVQSNVDRWFGQFQGTKEEIKAKSETVEIGAKKATFVQAEGTYSSGMPGGPKTPLKDYALFGAILESAQGNVFIRMTGPIPTVKKAQAAFRKMAEDAAK